MNKVAIDLVEKARRIKLDNMRIDSVKDQEKLKEKYSISDSETMLAQMGRTFNSTAITTPSMSQDNGDNDLEQLPVDDDRFQRHQKNPNLPQPPIRSTNQPPQTSKKSIVNDLQPINYNENKRENNQEQNKSRKDTSYNTSSSTESKRSEVTQSLEQRSLNNKKPHLVAESPSKTLNNETRFDDETLSDLKYSNPERHSPPNNQAIHKQQQSGSMSSPKYSNDESNLYQTASTPHLWPESSNYKSQSHLASNQSVDQNEDLYLKKVTRPAPVPQPNFTNTPTIAPSKPPEKLFSTRHLNQRVLVQNATSGSNKNLNTLGSNPNIPVSSGQMNFAAQAPPLTSSTGVSSNTGANPNGNIPGGNNNGFDLDSDGSEHSQFSYGSKVSSASVLSGQSEMAKASIRKKLGQSEGGRLGTIASSTQPLNQTSSLAASTPTLTNVNNEKPKSSTTQSSLQKSIYANNPTQAFFSQFTTPIQQQDKEINSSTMSLPGQNTLQGNSAATKKMGSSLEKTDGTMSDSALTNSAMPENANKKRRPSMAKALVILGLSKKNQSIN